MWAGTAPASMPWVPHAAIRFATLGVCNDAAAARARRRGETEATRSPSVGFAGGAVAGTVATRSPSVGFAGGAVAGTVATVVTYPFDVTRTLSASQGRPKVCENVLDAARGVARARGARRGLYAGLSVTLAEIIPASAVQFGSYAALKTRFPDVFGENAGYGGGGGGGTAAEDFARRARAASARGGESGSGTG